jgi:hypothetical protein
MSPELAQNLDELLDRSLRMRLKNVSDELADSVRDECSALIASAADRARSEGVSAGEAAVDSLAQCARRIRNAQAVTEIAAALVEAASGYCGRAALFIHRGDRALGFRAAGAVSESMQLEFQKLSIMLSEAPILAEVMEKLEPRDTHGDPGQLGSAVTGLLGLSPEDRVWLLPVALRDKVLAVLYLDPKGPDGQPRPIQSSAIEVLVALTEAWTEAVGNRKKLAAA